MLKIFLGGTCNNSTWRDELIPMIKIPYFNPVVDKWDYSAQLREEKEKQICKYHVYVITPKMTGIFSIAELVDDSNKRPNETLFCFLKKDGDLEFEESQWKSILATISLVKGNGVRYFSDLSSLATWINLLKI